MTSQYKRLEEVIRDEVTVVGNYSIIKSRGIDENYPIYTLKDIRQEEKYLVVCGNFVINENCLPANEKEVKTVDYIIGLLELEVTVVNNNIDIEDLHTYPCCDKCGAEFTEEKDINALILCQSTPSRDIYKCSKCKKESVYI